MTTQPAMSPMPARFQEVTPPPMLGIVYGLILSVIFWGSVAAILFS
ncbi:MULTISPECIES: hypothetical protein [Sphingomonas]|jgi:hypothetical protein|nr:MULTISPECIES: hypothetical protein [Sphingomonas]MBY0302692.1 hypothetical protein [Sphingomonas ginsenosidimutans]